MLSEWIKAPAAEMARKLEDEMKAALDDELPGWTLLDVQKRCRMVRVAGSPVETLYLDDRPLLEIWPIESRTETRGESIVVTFTRQVRRLP